MVEVWLPYGKVEVPVRVPDEQLVAVLEPPPAEKDLHATMLAGIEPWRAILSDRLKRASRVTIAVDDLLAMGKTAELLPPLLERLAELGLDRGKAAMVVAKDPGRKVRVDLDEGVLGLPIELHDHRASETKAMPVKSSELVLNKRFAEADVRIVVAEVRPELGEFAGVERVILRGLTGGQSVLEGYGGAVRPGHALTHEDIYGAWEDVFGVEFLCDSRRNVTAVFAGGLDAHQRALEETQRRSKHPVERKVDTVVASAGGYPFDLDLYTASSLLGNASRILKQEGVIVFAAECSNGYGDPKLAEWMKRFESLRELREQLAKEPDPIGLAALALRTGMEGAKVYLVSILPDFYASGTFRMRSAKTANAGLQSALRSAGRDAKIAVVSSCAVSTPELAVR